MMEIVSGLLGTTLIGVLAYFFNKLVSDTETSISDLRSKVHTDNTNLSNKVVEIDKNIVEIKKDIEYIKEANSLISFSREERKSRFTK